MLLDLRNQLKLPAFTSIPARIKLLHVYVCSGVVMPRMLVATYFVFLLLFLMVSRIMSPKGPTILDFLKKIHIHMQNINDKSI